MISMKDNELSTIIDDKLKGLSEEDRNEMKDIIKSIIEEIDNKEK